MDQLAHRYQLYWDYIYHTHLSDGPMPSHVRGEPETEDWVRRIYSAPLWIKYSPFVHALATMLCRTPQHRM